MKRIIGLVVVVGMMMVGVQAFGAWGVPALGGGDKKDSGGKVDVKALTAREGTLKIRVNKATVALASGLVEIQKACGKATEAAKLEMTLDEVKKNPSDIEGTKKLCAEVGDVSESLKKVDMDATMNKEEARVRLGKLLLHLGAGSLLDIQAANDAKLLVTDISNGVKAVQAAPMTYGMSAVKDLTSGLNTAKFVAETIPTQVSMIAELTKGLVKYAETNKIEIPSQKEQEKQAKDMEKE